MSKCTVISTRKANIARNHIHWFARVGFSSRVFDKSVYMYMNMLLPFAMWCGEDDIFKVLFMQARTHKNPLKRLNSTELFYWCITFVVRFRIICLLIQLNHFLFRSFTFAIRWMGNILNLIFRLRFDECMSAWFVFDTHSTYRQYWNGEKSTFVHFMSQKVDYVQHQKKKFAMACITNVMPTALEYKRVEHMIR